MAKRFEQYQDTIARLYPETIHEVVNEGGEETKVLSRPITFCVTNACQLRCKYCLPAGTQIKMSDFSSKAIEDIVEGDEILGFEEHNQSGKHTKLQKGVVTQLHHRKASTIALTFENGQELTITPNHKVLGDNYDYVEAGNLDVGQYVYGLIDDAPLLKQMKIIDIKENADEVDVYNIGTTCHTYIANNVAVHNCYETHKGNSFMSFETAKKFIDLLLSGEKGMDKYINTDISPAVVIEFIGGEPFLAIDLMDEIMDYWMDRTTELMHPWADKYMISICSNGVAYFEPKVQKFLEKHKDHMSFSVTIDGNKELHNACRVYAGTDIGCYDEAVAAAKDWMDRGYYMGSKVTLAPSNIQYMYDAIMHMVDMGYNEVLANCVYEAEWTNEDALLFYEQGKKLADEFLERDLDFENEFYCSLYEENYFHPKDEDDVENWCFPAGTMILTPNGEKPIETLSIGDNVISKNDINPIEDILVHESNDIVKIKASGMFDTLVTKEHPYWAMKKNSDIPEWIPVGQLVKGDKICLKNQDGCTWVDVDSVEPINETMEVYNLTVSNEHSFIANGAVVHNCGGNGVMIACDWDGEIYPCIRYMEMSLGNDQPKLPIGNVDDGIMQTPEQLQNVKCLQCVNRRTQSTDECFNCPIAEGCSWCTAWNYQLFGTPDKRCTRICPMHKARCLFNIYFWNKYYLKNNLPQCMDINIPEEWALEIISQEEFDMLKDLYEQAKKIK